MQLAIAMVMALLLFGCQTDETILRQLNESEANEVILALANFNIMAKKNIIPSKKENLFYISVKKDKVVKSLEVIQKNQLPKKNSSSLKDIFFKNRQGLLPSKTEEMALLALASQGEIEGLLKTLPNIIDAKVVFAIPQVDNWKKTESKRSASVVIVKNDQNDDLNIDEIKSLIANSINDLYAADVAVVVKTLENPNHLIANDEKIDLKKDNNILNYEKKSFIILLLISILALIVASYYFGRFRWMMKN